MIIRRFDVLSVGKIGGIIAAAFGLIFAIFFMLFSSLMGAAAMAQGENAFPMAGMGALALIVMPVMYGLIGFVGGALQAAIYNLAARFVGGVRVETE